MRLHFAGQFQADVSTVDNAPAHCEEAAFRPSYQALRGAGTKSPNERFDPQGDAAFRLPGTSSRAEPNPVSEHASKDVRTADGVLAATLCFTCAYAW